MTKGAALAITVACAALIALAGCGDDDDAAGDPAAADTDLRLSLDVDGSGGKPPREAEIICEHGMETSPCPQVAELTAADLAPVPPTQPCTEIFGGPETATITGTLHGEAVNATLSKRNGCEIERFGRAEPLLREVFGA